MPRTAPPAWRNRIVGEDLVSPTTLLPHPHNWRIHGALQSDAMAGVLGEIGWVQRILVNKRSGRVVDGHLRLKLALDRKEPTVPVLYVDLSEAEEALVLSTLDPIAAMAEADRGMLATLLQDVQSGDAGVQQLLATLAEEQGLVPPDGGDAGPAMGAEPVPSVSLAERFLVPPFSVLDARQGYWQDRKRAWLALGIQSELGRGDCMPSGASSVYAGSSPWSGKRGGGAAPGGSPRPAMRLKDGQTMRGDGHGRPLHGAAGDC